jgi:hypothetical protein
MDSIKNLTAKKTINRKKDPHLHSAAHVLADELSTMLRDKKHFGFYLKMATLYPPQILRKICGEVLENRNVKTPGKLFAYLIKQRNLENKESKQSADKETEQ